MMQEIEAHTPLGLTAQLNPLETYPFRAYFTGDTESVEDKGDGVEFCVFAYNVQDGVDIDYTTGETRLAS